MTNEELARIKARAEVGVQLLNDSGDCDSAGLMADVDRDALLAEIERLRGLIRAVEWVGSCCYDSFCAWCGDPQSYDQQKTGHNDDCPAFTKAGDVR